MKTMQREPYETILLQKQNKKIFFFLLLKFPRFFIPNNHIQAYGNDVLCRFCYKEWKTADTKCVSARMFKKLKIQSGNTSSLSVFVTVSVCLSLPFGKLCTCILYYLLVAAVLYSFPLSSWSYVIKNTLICFFFLPFRCV